MGGPKALVRVDERTLLERAVSTAQASGCRPVVVVLGAAAADVAAQVDLAAARVVVNPGWDSGMGGSLAAGLAAVEGEPAGAVVVLLVDQPGVTPAAVTRLVAAWRGGAAIAAATYQGTRRNPVLFDRAVWGELTATLAGDTGARDFLRGNAHRVIGVECADVADPRDLDTADDLARWSG